jgi:hypothetical protein
MGSPISQIKAGAFRRHDRCDYSFRLPFDFNQSNGRPVAGQLADGIAERQKVSANIKNLFTFSFDSQYILASIERKARITIKY